MLRLTGSIVAGFLRPMAVRFCGAYEVSDVLVPFACDEIPSV